MVHSKARAVLVSAARHNPTTSNEPAAEHADAGAELQAPGTPQAPLQNPTP